MEDLASLRQTVTHLFDAVRHSSHAKELEESARTTEAGLEEALNKLESQTEELTNVLSSMKDDPEGAVRELSKQVAEFLSAAKGQARNKLERKAKSDLDEYRRAAAAEKDKAIKSLEAYLASNPLPIVEASISVRLREGVYQARASYESEGDIKYEFGLASQNSALFHEELPMSRLDTDVRIPVRFSRTVLKGRVPGFEQLDQYVLTDAETSAGKLRANFQKTGDGARLKVVTSRSDSGFVGLEYSDQAHSVNVMNDPSLSAHVDLEAVKKVATDLATELEDLAIKKVSLTALSLGDENLLESLDCYQILRTVLDVLGPKYRSLLEKMPQSQQPGEANQLSINFVRERLKILGEFSKPVSQVMGLKATA